MNQASPSSRTFFLLLFYLSLALSVPGWSEQSVFRAEDGSVEVALPSEFEKTVNPHAVLAAMTADRAVFLVTAGEITRTLDEAFLSTPGSLPPEQICLGRTLISIDGEQAALFLIDGMFPPGQEATHLTALAVVIRENKEFNLMFHSPLTDTQAVLEEAHSLFEKVRWSDSSAAEESHGLERP